MTKSVPTGTQQTQTQNQTGQAQLPFLQDLWGRAQQLNNTGTGENFLQGLRDNSWLMEQNTAGPGYGYSLVPNAMNFTNQALSGSLPQGNLPAGPQIGGLGSLAGGAVGTGTQYGQGLSDQAYNAINAGLSGRYDLAGLAPGALGTGQQYGGALSGIGQGAVNTGTGYGGAIANAAYGAPGTVAPWTQGMGSLAGAAQNVANPAAAGLYGNAGMAIGGNPIYDSLRGMASGQYIDPSRNPALAGTIQAATQPLVNQYMTATAPQTASGFEGSGRYGSGAMANAVAQNQQNLGLGLGGAVSNIVNNAYNTGLQSTLGAGSALGQAYNTGTANISDALARAGALGQSGVQNAANIMQQGGALDLNALQQMMSGLGTAGQVAGQGYQTGTGAYNAAAQAANQGYSTGSNILSQAGQLGNQGYATGGQMLANAAQAANQGYGTGVTGLSQAGSLANTGTLNLGSIAQTTPDLANWPNSQLSAAYNSLWSPLQNYGGIVGPAQTGATQTNTSGTQQQNVASNILGTALGAASLAKKI